MSLLERVENFLAYFATRDFLKLNADNRYYRINLNGIRECVEHGKEHCTARNAFGLVLPYLEHDGIEYKDGWGSEKHDKNTPFANDDGEYLFIKASPKKGKSIEKDLQDWIKLDRVNFEGPNNYTRSMRPWLYTAQTSSGIGVLFQVLADIALKEKLK